MMVKLVRVATQNSFNPERASQAIPTISMQIMVRNSGYMSFNPERASQAIPT